MDTSRSPSRGKICTRGAGFLHEVSRERKGDERRLHLEPLPRTRITGDLLEALGPSKAGRRKSQYCVFRSGRERFCLPVLDVEKCLIAVADKSSHLPRHIWWEYSICAAPSCR